MGLCETRISQDSSDKNIWKCSRRLVLKKSVRIAGLLSIIFMPVGLTAQTVYTIPQLRAELSGVLEVGVKVQGTVVQKFDSTATIQSTFQQSNSYTVTNTVASASSNSFTYTATQTPKPPPSAGGFLTGLVGAITTGSPAPLLPFVANALDYTIDPVSRDWKRVYTRSNSNSTATQSSIVSAQSSADSFVQSVTAKLTSEYTYDINSGYLRTGIRVRNLGSRSITIANPRFAVFFENDNSGSVMGGLGLAYQSNPAGGEALFIPAGGSIDLNWELSGQHFPNLVRRYASADRIAVVLQSVQYAVSSGGPLYVEQEIETKRVTGITLHIRSDNYSIGQVVIPPAGGSGMMLQEVLNAAGLSPTFADPLPQRIELALTGIDPDLNPSPVPIRPEMPGDSLRAWRRWIVVVRNSQNAVVTQFGTNDLLRPGFTVSIHQLRGHHVLGPLFRPVVSSMKGVRITPNERVRISSVPLEEGDEVVFSKLKVDSIRVSFAEYQRRVVTNEYRQLCGAPVITNAQCGAASWTPYLPMGYASLASSYQVPNVNLAPGSPPVVLYQPVRAEAPLTMFKDVFQVQAAPGIDPEPILNAAYRYLLAANLRPYRNATAVKRRDDADSLVVQTADPFAALRQVSALPLTLGFDVTRSNVPAEWVIRTDPPLFVAFAMQEPLTQPLSNVVKRRLFTLPLFPEDTSNSVIAPLMFRISTPTLSVANTDASPVAPGSVFSPTNPSSVWNGQVNHRGGDPTVVRLLLQTVERTKFPDLRLFPLSGLSQLGGTTASVTVNEPAFVLTADVEVVRAGKDDW
jgi:hypothetical protein